jgi:para-aminobenzoate synthetase
MNTLLVDNFDSYTYNLFQLIARVQGAEPVVLRNDAPETDLDLDAFDNIVISPGPGHPGNSRDFGISRRVLAEATVPVLGVCLGHQGIGLMERAEVGPAPAARHGHLAAIRHDDPELFDGIPQDFIAVRYHSLCVREPLPETLHAIAWADDGVLMGLRHRDRPLWGVQFHPESVLTEHGDRLLANFTDLTRRRTGRAAITVSQPFNAAEPEQEPPAPRPVGFRLRKRVLDRAIDAESAFAARFARAPRAFWLDSSQVGPGQARFSFLGDGTGPLAEFVRYDIRTRTTEVQRPGQLPRTYAGSVFDYLDGALAERRVDDPTLPFDFTCGYVGYFGYEMKADCGATNTRHAPTPDASWMFADRLVVVDHEEDTTYAICLAEDTPSGLDTADQWLDRTVAFLQSLQKADDLAPPLGAGASVEPWLLRNKQWYLADVEACKRELMAGESYEICLTNAAWLPAPTDPLGYYRVLRRFNPAPYAAYLQFGDVTVACSSPERFLKIGRDKTVETKPIKGTARRDGDPVRDAELRTALAQDPKSHAENLMIVDLLRNDLGQVCEVGSVHVPKLMAVESYATVHQLVSTVRGRLRDDTGALDCVRACFPGGSMTGAPKLRTLEIIDSLETEARGVYSGTIGFLSCNGAADLNIVIRTAVMVEGRMHLGAGGAIVLDSDPEAEYEEMLLKLAAPMRAYRAWMAAQGLRDTQRPASQRPHHVNVANLPRRWPNGRITVGANAAPSNRVPVAATAIEKENA